MARTTDKKQLIMKAAESLFTSRRFHEVTTEDIAAAAKVGKGTIYRYFKDKDDLFWQVASGGFDEMCGLIEAQVEHDVPFDEQLRRAWEVISVFHSRRRQLFRMMQAEESRMPWVRGRARTNWCEKRQRLTSAVAEIITRGVEEGQIRDDIPATTLASLLLGMLRAQAREMSEAGDGDPALFVEFFRRGAAPIKAKVSAS